MIIAPIAAGFLANILLRRYAEWRDRLLPLVLMGAICLVLEILTAAARDQLLEAAVSLVVLVIVHNTSGYLPGYWGARGAGLSEGVALLTNAGSEGQKFEARSGKLRLLAFSATS